MQGRLSIMANNIIYGKFQLDDKVYPFFLVDYENLYCINTHVYLYSTYSPDFYVSQLHYRLKKW